MAEPFRAECGRGLRFAVRSASAWANSEYQFANAVANCSFPGENGNIPTQMETKLRGYFLKRFSNAWRASRGRETRSGDAAGPDGGADGAVSFSIVVRNS